MNVFSVITVVILTRNEAASIAQCIESIPDGCVILVVDSGSTDETCKIATEKGARVIVSPWPGHFAQQRNLADANVHTDWILHLDADETFSAEMAGELREFITSGAYTASIVGRFPRKELIFGKWIEHGGWYPQYKLRLYKRNCGHWEGRVHENFVGYNALPHTFHGPLLHDSYRDIHTFIDKFNRYSSLDADEAIQAGNSFSFLKMFFQPLERFIGRYIVHKGYRDGMHGLVLAALIAMNYFMRYIKIWEKQYRK